VTVTSTAGDPPASLSDILAVTVVLVREAGTSLRLENTHGESDSWLVIMSVANYHDDESLMIMIRSTSQYSPDLGSESHESGASGPGSGRRNED
jgi:hypothetical protein